MARPLPSPVSRTESFGSGDLVKDSINTSLCIHVQVNLGFFRCYTLRLLSIFFQLRKLSSPGSAFSYIYRDCACEHTGFTCVCFVFSNLFRTDLPQRCPVAVVCWLFLQTRHCLRLWALHQGFALPWPRTKNYEKTVMEQTLEGVLRPHKCGVAGLALLPGEERFWSSWGSTGKFRAPVSLHVIISTSVLVSPPLPRKSTSSSSNLPVCTEQSTVVSFCYLWIPYPHIMTHNHKITNMHIHMHTHTQKPNTHTHPYTHRHAHTQKHIITHIQAHSYLHACTLYCSNL